MMPIKFRAYDADDKVMRSWEEIDFTKDIGADYYMVGYKASPVSVKYDHKQALMQYTGLKDKNGVEIYEGDVLFHPLQGRRKVFYPYSETVASYGLRDIDNGFGSTLQDSHAIWEVIGNIYENPELLGREQK